MTSRESDTALIDDLVRNHMALGRSESIYTRAIEEIQRLHGALDAARRLYDNGDVDKFIRWFFVRLAKTDHACMTGDCGHNDGNDCVQAVKNAYIGDCDERIGTSTETDR